MDTNTGKIRELAVGEEPKESEVLITEEEKTHLEKFSPHLRLEEYNKLVKTRQVRRAKARLAKKAQRRNRGKR